MENNELKEILNAVYELEGLIQLSLNGKQDAMRLRDLMIDKSDLIASLCRSLPGGARPQQPAPQSPEQRADDAALGAATLFEEKQMASVTPPETPAPGPLYRRHSAPATPPPAPIQAPVISTMSEPLPQQPRIAPAVRRPALRRLFPLNEMYMYRRELFSGSDDDFNASLAIVEGMDNYSLAAEYFYSDLQWDVKNPTVEQFMKIIQKYFKQ